MDFTCPPTQQSDGSAGLIATLLNTRDAHTAPALLLLAPSSSPRRAVPVPPQPQSTDHRPTRPSVQAPGRRSTAPGASPLSMSLTYPAIRFTCGGQAACCDLPGTGEWCGDGFKRGKLWEVWSMHASSRHLAHAACFCLCLVEGCPIPAHAGTTVQQPTYSPSRTPPSLSAVHSCAHPVSLAACFCCPLPSPTPLPSVTRPDTPTTLAKSQHSR